MKQTLELLGKDMLTPHTAAEKLVELSVQYARLVSKLAEAEVRYNKELRGYLEENPELPANKAQIRARGGDLYGVMRGLQAEERGAVEIIRSLKKYIRIKESEHEFSSNL